MTFSKPALLSGVSPWPCLVLAVTLGLTWLVWDHERQTTRTLLQSQFDFALREAVSRVDQRVAGYEQILRGTQGLLTIASTTNRQAFRSYVETLGLDANFSGNKGVGLIEFVPGEKKTAHEAEMRRRGLTDYAIHPSGVRDMYTPIVQREPESVSKQTPLGYDSFSEPVRREAMTRARDSGAMAITGKVRLLIDEALDAPAGFIMYLPLYAQGNPRDSVTDRRTNLTGWVYASFHMRDFMASLYGEAFHGLTVEIYDDVTPVETSLLYRSENTAQQSGTHPAISATEYLVVGGHTWTLVFSTQPEFESRFSRDASNTIAVTGVILSALLAMLVWLMVTGKERAQRIAAVMTEELRHMAQHDPLTDLPNRALFTDRLTQELARAKRQESHLALIFIDVDHFKQINDHYGHGFGDQVLKQVAQRLQDSVRASDTVGRMGGDEFVVVIPEIADPEAATVLAEKIRQTLRQHYFIDHRELLVTVSFGIAIYPEDGTDEITLTKSADDAMYSVKQSGRDGVRLAG